MKTLVLISVFFLTSFQYVPQDINDLFGRWECYHKELEDGTKKSTDLFSGEASEISCDDLILELKSDFSGSESIGGITFKFEMNDSILTLGNRNYVIEKLSTSELIIRDFDIKKTNLFNYRQKFRKIE